MKRLFVCMMTLSVVVGGAQAGAARRNSRAFCSLHPWGHAHNKANSIRNIVTGILGPKIPVLPHRRGVHFLSSMAGAVSHILDKVHGAPDTSDTSDTPDKVQDVIDLEEENVALSTAETDGDGRHNKAFSHLNNVADEIQRYRDALNLTCEQSRFYTIDGTCNNLNRPRLGAAFEAFVRELPAAYNDGKTAPRQYATGSQEPLPSARAVSTKCFPSVAMEDGSLLDPSLNQNHMQFGQYFAHDLGLTPVMEGLNCCSNLSSEGVHPDTFNNGPCFPIMVPDGDRHFPGSCMVFNRSIFEKDGFGVAQQLNAATHFIDQSAIYGSTEMMSEKLRSFERGKLETYGMNMLPLNSSHKCLLHHPLPSCPMSGDNRVSVWPGLTATHLIFHLEHNRVAEALYRLHPGWTDERLFQEARAVVIAQTQNLVYREYLPSVLGSQMMAFFKLNAPASYNPDLDPTLINAFQAAAFRFGHSQINNVFHMNSTGFSTQRLQDLYFRPHTCLSPTTGQPMFDRLLVSLMARPAQKFDATLPEGVTDFLFVGVDRAGQSSDLGARNVQRGRDHGLPPYLHYLTQAKKELGALFFQDQGAGVPDCAFQLYRSPGDVDLFVGGLHERPVRGGVVGPTFAFLIGKQFRHLRQGDRLFFDTQGSQAGFTPAQVQSIKGTSYAGIICRAMGLQTIQRDAFRVPDSVRNPFVRCEDLTDVNFSLWQ